MAASEQHPPAAGARTDGGPAGVHHVPGPDAARMVAAGHPAGEHCARAEPVPTVPAGLAGESDRSCADRWDPADRDATAEAPDRRTDLDRQ